MKYLMFLACLLISWQSTGEVSPERMDSQQFLDSTRQFGRNRSWGAMSGTISHLRKGSPAIATTLYMGILFAKERTLAQIVIANKQGYLVGQDYLDPAAGTSVLPINKNGYKQPLLAEFGIRPQDLTMSFVYWQFVSELPEERIKGLTCRLFILKDYKSTEHVKVFFSSQYGFPLKVEWFKEKYTTESEPYRTLEVLSFKKEKDFWLVSELNLFGPGWRTKINFEKTDAGFIAQGIPPALFKEMPDEKE